MVIDFIISSPVTGVLSVLIGVCLMGVASLGGQDA